MYCLVSDAAIFYYEQLQTLEELYSERKKIKSTIMPWLLVWGFSAQAHTAMDSDSSTECGQNSV
jgi:hypothetical protein